MLATFIGREPPTPRLKRELLGLRHGRRDGVGIVRRSPHGRTGRLSWRS